MSAIEDMYQGVLRVHYDAPHNYGHLDDASAVGRTSNPICGDEVTVYLRMQGEQIVATAFEGHLCAVSRASASLMTDAVNGQTIAQTTRLHAGLEAMLRGQEDRDRPLRVLEALRIVSRYRVRVRCALLPWEALRKACDAWQAAR